MDIRDFLSETTLQKTHRFVLQMDLTFDAESPSKARAWLKLLRLLLEIWCEGNSLETLEVRDDYVPLEESRRTCREDNSSSGCYEIVR